MRIASLRRDEPPAAVRAVLRTGDGRRYARRVEHDFDCVIVGGGVAGLSAAMVLGRARRRTLVLDAGEQSNRAAAHVGGLLGHDGIPPETSTNWLVRRSLPTMPSSC